jgi:adenosylcobinamide amidohydrolase
MQDHTARSSEQASTNWEILARLQCAVIRRRGRYIVIDLVVPHRTLSTSTRNGGQTEKVRHLLNHQSCEATGHDARFEIITGQGMEAYHDTVCNEVGLSPDDTAVMGTAANMNYAAIVRKRHEDLEVVAVVTAGVESNATCAGDPAVWHETPGGFVKLPNGTINTMVVSNTPVTSPALAQVAMMMVEGKTAALRRLAVPSRYSADLATGTGTDQYCVAAPIEGRKPLTTASSHMKFGETIGLAVREATLEALRWQNGLEPSYTRGLLHALGRFGLTEQSLLDGLAKILDPADFELIKKNSKAVIYEPHVGAAAHAMAAVLDRARYGILPKTCVQNALAQQAALLAANLAAKPDNWPKYHARLQATEGDVNELAVAAIALGWSDKWRAS